MSIQTEQALVFHRLHTVGDPLILFNIWHNISKIVAATDLPVSMDLEGGYGVSPDEVAETVRLAAQTGIVGLNLEDQIVGGEGFFAPGLADENMIKRLCAEANLPVNIIALPHVPEKQTLIDLGVSRISHGPVPYKKMSAWLAEQAKAAFA